MNGARRKYNCYRTLKTICYLLGFPLLLLLVYFSSTSMIYDKAFSDTKYYGIMAVALMWLVVIILQALFSMFTKSKNAKTMFGMIITLVIIIGGAFAFDIYCEKRFKQIEEENVQYGTSMKSYKYQINYFETITSDKSDLTDAYKKEVDRFCRVYNVGIKPKCYSEDLNIDKTIPVYDKNTDSYYSPNGMYADGHIFSMEQSIDILITYHETRNLYEKQKKDADKELLQAIATVKNSAEYQAYQATEEYKTAYGTNGTAYNYMLTIDKVDIILSHLGKGLGDALEDLSLITSLIPASISQYLDLLDEDLSIGVLADTINGLKVEFVLSFLGIENELMDVLYEALMPILKYAVKEGTIIPFDTLENFKTSLNNLTLKNLLNELNFEKLTNVLNNFGIDITEYQSIFNNGITVEFIENLVNELSLTSNLFFYQATTVKPVFDFIKDETLKNYAYAKYYATIHGSNVGSVLIGDNVGAVTFGSGGYPSNFGFTLKELYQLRMDNSYIPKAYPLFAARRYMYVMGGLMLLLTAIYYHFSRKEDESFGKMTNGGKR